VLPRRVRNQPGDITKLFATKAQDQSLGLYRLQEMDQLAAKMDQASATSQEVRVFSRMFFASMEEVEVDGAGRILIPDRLAQYAGLKHEVVLVGVRDHLELWDATRWQQYEAQNATQF